MSSNYDAIRTESMEWVRQAGEVVLRMLGHAVPTRKEDQSFVTDADHAVQEHLLRSISARHPGDAVISEETQAAPEQHSPLTGAQRCWVVDPIDGTRSFMRRFPGFSISVALLEAGEPVVGLVYNPLTEQMYSASQGGGAWCDDRRLRVEDRPVGGDTLLAIPSSRYGALSPAVHYWLDHLVVRNLGSTALHLALLAAGALDAVFGQECKLWDLAAGEILVREAGGQIRSLEGKPYFPIDPASYPRTDMPFLAAGPKTLGVLLDDYRRLCGSQSPKS